MMRWRVLTGVAFATLLIPSVAFGATEPSGGTSGGNKTFGEIWIKPAGSNVRVTEGWIGTASGNKQFFIGANPDATNVYTSGSGIEYVPFGAASVTIDVGGGGGGGGGGEPPGDGDPGGLGGGGGEGGQARRTYAITAADWGVGLNYSVGSGGSGGSPGNEGTVGGDSTVTGMIAAGSISMTGGGGAFGTQGNTTSNGSGGAGGTASGGTTNTTGDSGGVTGGGSGTNDHGGDGGNGGNTSPTSGTDGASGKITFDWSST